MPCIKEPVGWLTLDFEPKDNINSLTEKVFKIMNGFEKKDLQIGREEVFFIFEEELEIRDPQETRDMIFKSVNRYLKKKKKSLGD